MCSYVKRFRTLLGRQHKWPIGRWNPDGPVDLGSRCERAVMMGASLFRRSRRLVCLVAALL